MIHLVKFTSTAHKVHLVQPDPLGLLEEFPEYKEPDKDWQRDAAGGLSASATVACCGDLLCDNKICSVPVSFQEGEVAVEENDGVDEEESAEKASDLRPTIPQVLTYPYQLRYGL